VQLTHRLIPRVLVGAVALALVAVAVAAMSVTGSSTADAAQEEALTIKAGFGTGTVSGNAYGPGEVTVPVGTSITWIINSDEPHTVTFGQGPEGVPPPGWPSTFDVEPIPFQPIDLGEVEHDSDAFINTDVIFKGSTVTITMTEEGTFSYNCVIHPGMTGHVNVVSEEETGTTQDEADAIAAEVEALLLGQVDALRQQALDAVETETRDDGTTLWTVPVGAANPPEAMPGGGSGYMELLEYFPEDLEIKAGDTVRWEAEYLHTVTFLEPSQDPATLGDPFAVEPAKPSEEYDGESFYNSGMMAAGPDAPTDFELTFPDEGTFPYLCLLHAPIGHVGTVNVETLPVELPVTGGPPDGGGTSAGLLALIAAAGAAALAGSALVLLTVRR
jgi:plastocyanin